MRGTFQNEPLTDFSLEANRKKMEEAIREFSSTFGKEYDCFIGGKPVRFQETFVSRNPSKPSEIVGVFPKARNEDAEKALLAAEKAFESWKRVPAKERADLLFLAADGMRERRFLHNASMVLEAGKTWPEADGDTAEAIDFLEFYGREALRYAGEQPVTPFPGERPELRYIPLGVGLVIPPWNFPLAILCGMTSAAIAAGNTVVLKPSSETPVIGALFNDLMRSVGVPDGVLNFITGPGAVGGDYLVRHPRTRFISFTGSKEVGLGVIEKAGKAAPGQIWIKRVVAEMGGKDAIVVDSEADLDAAAAAVSASAFGLQGQKCSACSRAIVVAGVYDAFLEKLLPIVRKIKVGDPRDFSNTMGPVVSEKAMNTILSYIDKGKSEGKLAHGGNRIGSEGYFIEPTVIADVAPRAVIAQEEIFGPVLAVIRAKDYDDALRIANDTEYGLTGSVYTRNRAKIERAKEEFHVGNLYINRKCTGALVGVHPFGGFNMSGTDSKAGGRDYLLLFLQAKSISEKIEQP
ncbi:MAG: L-glutamate gamma-semialdehyde dehydrogenase [Candidatus Eisenbacteria bacterium]|nr:L-glutamate gamma-semialdehyde dehydrogenase [Candidatus Eisenbacteria bacterium]